MAAAPQQIAVIKVSVQVHTKRGAGAEACVPEECSRAALEKYSVLFFTLQASIAAGRIVQQEVGDWKTRWIRLTFIITYNVLEFVFISAVFYCETSA